MSNKKQTAVDFLIQELGEYFPIGIGGIELMVEKAKEIEKQQKGYSEEEVSELVDALNKISQFSDVGNDFLAVVKMKSIAVEAIKQFKKK